MSEQSMEQRQNAAMEEFLKQGVPDVKVTPPAPAPAPVAPRVAIPPVKGESPVGWIVLGILIAWVGGAVMGFGASLDESSAGWLVGAGVIVTSIGMIAATIGTIGAGVAMGLARYYGPR